MLATAPGTEPHTVGLAPEATAPRPDVPTPERLLAPVMFALALLDLVTLAGLIHRSTQPEVTLFELRIMYGIHLALWPVFCAEAAFGVLRRCPEVSFGKALARGLLVAVLPSARLAWVNPATNRIWLPWAGWQRPGKAIAKTLDKVFGGPMLVFAFLILPVLLFEYIEAETVRSTPRLAFAVHSAVALIWVAFAAEFIVKVSASPNSLKYVKERWLDLAIVALPTLEFVLHQWASAAPLARLLRLSRAASPEQLAKLGRAYRLRGLLMKGWHAFLLLEGVARITGNTTEKRLRKLDEQIADLEEVLAELRREADDLRKQAASNG